MSGGFRYIWDGIDIAIVQPALTQRKESCSFAATARQIEYDLRIRYANSWAPVEFPAEPILLHKSWEDYLRQRHKEYQRRWKPIALLKEALAEDVENPSAESRSGCPLRNTGCHWIDEKHVLACNEITVERVRELFSRRIPLIAVIAICSGYPDYSEKPYTGLTEEGNLDSYFLSDDGKYMSHAVVLIREYEAPEDNPYNVAPDTYWIYQNSFPKHAENRDGLLGNGMSFVHPRVVLEAYYSISYPACLFMHSGTPTTLKLIAKQAELTKQRRLEREDYVQRKRKKLMEQG